MKIEFSAISSQTTQYHETVYHCPISFNSDALRLWLPIDIISLPIPSSDPYLKHLLNQQAEALVKALPNPDPFLKNLQDLIVQTLKTGEPTAEHIAKKMNISVRTFYRKLNNQSVQYADLIKRIRQELAKSYLTDSKLSLAEITFLLGYAEQSAFSRAFKQWENISPSAYRKLHSHDQITTNKSFITQHVSITRP